MHRLPYPQPRSDSEVVAILLHWRQSLSWFGGRFGAVKERAVRHINSFLGAGLLEYFSSERERQFSSNGE